MRRLIRHAFLGTPRTDPHWGNVVLLAANDNKANASTSFADQSMSGHALTTVSGAKYSSAAAPTGMQTSMILNGSGDYLSTPDSVDWSFGNGDFTIEGMMSFSSLSNYGSLVSQYATVTSNASFDVRTPKTADQNLSFQYTTDGSTNKHQDCAWTPTLNTWYHVAICRSGTSIKLFVNGSQAGTTLTTSDTIFDSSSALLIGRLGNTATYDTNGYMSNIRVTKGSARYTSNFTPPTLPLPSMADHNYTKLNSADKGSNIAVTGNTATGGGSWQSVRGNIGKASGKYTFEVTFNSSNTSVAAGFGNSAMDVTSYIGATGISAGFQDGSGGGLRASSVTTSGSAPAAGVGPYMFALDLSAGKGWIAVGGSWVQGDPAAGTSPTFTWTPGTTMYPVLSIFASGVWAKLNAGAAPFGNTVPSGFIRGWF